MKSLELLLERLLWASRVVMIVPVIISLFLALGALLVYTIDAAGVLVGMLGYLNPALTEAERAALAVDKLADIVGIIDGYLIAAILFIFALGLYELFVNKIDVIEGSELGSRLLLIRNLDDLKDRLANMIVVILIVKFFQQALGLKYATPLDLLALAVGIVLLGAALYLTGRTNLIKKEKSGGTGGYAYKATDGQREAEGA